MKKISLTALLIGLATLSSCSMIPGLTPSVENPLESLEAGVIPTGGEEVDFEQLESIFNDETKEETTLRNGLSVKVLNTTFEVCNETQYVANGYSYGYKNVMKVNNANAELSLTGLTSATELNQFAGAAKASADVYYLNQYDNEKDEFSSSLAAEGYVKEGNLYLNLNEDAYKLVYGSDENKTFKAYTEIPSEFKDLILEGGFTLPLLSDTNIEFLERMLEEFANNDNVSSSVSQIVLSEEVLSVAFDTLFTVNKYADTYLLSLDLNKENVPAKAETILDKLYADGFLNSILGPAFGTSSITAEQYSELKSEFLTAINDYVKDFSHAKLSVVFDEVMVKSISADVDFTYKTSYKDLYYENNSTATVKLLTNIVFEYADTVAVSYPDFAGYEYIPSSTSGSGESIPSVK